MMYLCFNCGHVFDEPEIRHPVRLDEYSELRLCPHCGRSDLTAAEICDLCGEVFPEDELFCGLCPECYEEKEAADAAMEGRYNPFAGVMNMFDIPLRMMGVDL